MILEFVGRWPRWLIVLLAVAFIAAVGALDYRTGWELQLSPLYLIPIFFVSWFSGRTAGLMIAAACAVVWDLAQLASGQPYARPSLSYWNTAMELVIFCVVSLTISALEIQLLRERESARTDELTGLPNRRSFMEAASVEVDRARRYGGALTIACLDLDGFKAVNDRDGHAAGDRLLIRIGSQIRSSLRATDFIARVGGDEFYLLFPQTWAVEADALLSRIWAGLQVFMRDAGWDVTSSIGAVTFEGAPASVEEMAQLADRLMYSAKKSGGDRVDRRVVSAEETGTEWGPERHGRIDPVPNDAPEMSR